MHSYCREQAILLTNRLFQGLLKGNDHSKHVLSLNGHLRKKASEKEILNSKAYIQPTSLSWDKRKDTLQGFI